MWNWLKKIFIGDNCKHQWELLRRYETVYYTKSLFVCKTCGKFKKVTL